ncbi:MAG: hypothetical protein WCF67_16040 [Chitinophagaceae bacterium]
MKWTLMLSFSFAIIAGCSKSNMTTDDADISTKATSSGIEKNSLVGTWRAIEYFQDRGDGTGQWFGVTEADEVTFTESGEVIISGNSPIATRGYNRYRVIDANHVELYSTSNSNKDVFYYNRESETSLLFNPQCRENCSRRYRFVG